jgi:hypothetical protein
MDTVGILMLLEGVVALTPPKYRFDRLQSVLRGWPGFGYRYDVDVVRYDDTNTQIELAFDALAQGRYAQLWLIGTGQFSGAQLIGKRLTAPHREHIHAFMAGGGGVFATGDHESVGATLCDSVARVAQMRTWSGPPSEGGPDRIDTGVGSPWPYRRGKIVRQGVAGGPANLPAMDLREVHPLDEDETVKTIWPSLVGGKAHPLMQIPTGGDWPPATIRLLPDHQHEGACHESVPDDVLRDTFESVSPAVVAWGAAVGYDMLPPGRPRVYGTVACHDPGTRSGRVVVDSTFHHLTDENTEMPRMTPAWYHIEQYVLNIANWLTGARAENAIRQFLAQNDATLDAKELGWRAIAASPAYRRAIDLAAQARIPRDMLPGLLDLRPALPPPAASASRSA